MKGIFYSAITILFIMPIILFAFVYLGSIETQDRALTTKSVGDKLASFAVSVDKDIPRALDIISSRAIGIAVTHVDSTGQALDNAEVRLKEIMVNGTLNGNATAQTFTFTTWTADVRTKGNNYGFTTDVQLLGVEVKPFDSYHLNVSVSMIVNVTARGGAMSVYRIYRSEAHVPINEFSDPLYTLKTNGILKRVITPPSADVVNVAALDNAVDKKFYMASTDGPSFLDRLEGHVTISPSYAGIPNIGLETIVNLPEIQANELEVKPTQSRIDYLYFDTSSHSGQLVNQSSYNWLRLDATHAVKYNVTLLP